MSAEETLEQKKLKILIADKLHDFTDRTRMTDISTSEKNNIVNYIEDTLLNIVTSIPEYSSITPDKSEFSEDKIVSSYYPNIPVNRDTLTKITIKSEEELYELTPEQFIFIQNDPKRGAVISMQKYLFQYVPRWLQALYKNKSFMLDVTVLTENDICNGVVSTNTEKMPIILKTIATEYDRNVENKIVEPCSGVYPPSNKSKNTLYDKVLLTKKNSELLGFDSITLVNQKTLKWTLGSKEGIINIDKIIKSKKNSLRADSESETDIEGSAMSLPLFFKMIGEILNNKKDSKRNTYKSFNKKIKQLYGLGLHINEVDSTLLTNTTIDDIDLYILCLTDLKSLGDLLQVKFAELSNSIMVSNDRTTCLMSSIGYNNTTLRTAKLRLPDKTSIRELFLFDDKFEFSEESKKLLQQVQEERRKEEEALKLKKIDFIKELHEIIKSKKDDILDTKDKLTDKITKLDDVLQNAKEATLQEIHSARTRPMMNVINFNYEYYKMKLELILLKYHVGFIYILLRINNLNPSEDEKGMDTILADRTLLNVFLDEDKVKQQEYINSNLSILDSLYKQLEEYEARELVSRKFELIKLNLFNYPHLDIKKLYNLFSSINKNKGYVYVNKKLNVIDGDMLVEYTAGIFKEQSKLDYFIEKIDYIEERAKQFYTSQKNLYESKKRRLSKSESPITKKTKRGGTRVTSFRKSTIRSKITRGITKTTNAKTFKTLRKTNPTLASSEDLVIVFLNYLVNKYNESSSDTERGIIKVLIFQTLFYVELYDISIPITNINLGKITVKSTRKTTSRQTNRVTGKKPEGKLETILEGPEEGGSISNKKFQFSQNLISQFLDRLRL